MSRARAIVTVMHHGDDGPVQTIADYVHVEEHSEIKHEFIDGVIRAMSGGTLEHSRLASAVIVELTMALRAAGRPCVVLTSGARVHVEAANVITYPDVSVVCGPSISRGPDPLALHNPLVIVEVTSPSTERYDRGRKFARYRTLPSLQEYVLVSHRERLIEVFRRGPGGDDSDGNDGWPLAARGLAGQQVELTSIGCRLSVDDIYDDPRGLAS